MQACAYLEEQLEENFDLCTHHAPEELHSLLWSFFDVESHHEDTNLCLCVCA